MVLFFSWFWFFSINKVIDDQVGPTLVTFERIIPCFLNHLIFDVIPIIEVLLQGRIKLIEVLPVKEACVAFLRRIVYVIYRLLFLLFLKFINEKRYESIYDCIITFIESFTKWRDFRFVFFNKHLLSIFFNVIKFICCKSDFFILVRVRQFFDHDFFK